MIDEEKVPHEHVHYVIPRRMVISFVVSYVVLLLLIITSFQYTNYVSRQLCGLISLSDDSYRKVPPSTPAGKALAAEFVKIHEKYHCK